MYSNKVVVVTGSSNGIGKAIASEYSKKNAVVIGIDIEEPNSNYGNIDFYKANLSDEKAIQVVFKDITKKYGSVHVLINNGAISKFNKSIYEISLSEFDKVIGVNLRGSFMCCKEFIKANKGQNYGRIINIASTRVNQNEPGWESYGASKGGLVSLTNTMAISLSDTPITVNAISPGWIETEDYEKLKDVDHKQHPSGRVGKPNDIVNTCMFLTIEDNDFINGCNIVVDGGMSKKMIYE